MKFSSFNTGRPYASNGQVVCAVCAPDEESTRGESVWFYDTARCVIGKIPDETSLAWYRIMEKYDRGQFEETSMSDPHIRAIEEYFGLT